MSLNDSAVSARIEVVTAVALKIKVVLVCDAVSLGESFLLI